MAASKKKTKRKNSKGRRFAFPALDGDRLRRIINAAGWVGLVAVVVGACWFGVPRLRSAVATPEAPVQIRFIDPPTWVGESLLVYLADRIRPELTAHPLDRDALVTAHEMLTGVGCFERVDQVRRTSDGVIEVDAAFLVPFAAIRDQWGDALIDSEGRLLPEGYTVRPEHTFTFLVNPSYERPMRPSLHWDGADISAALRLLRFVGNTPWIDQVTGIDLSDFQRTGQLTVLTATPCRILWGAPPGDESALEAMAERKLECLDHLYRRHGRIDQGHVGELDLTGATIVVKR